jgi:hypothetical protein
MLRAAELVTLVSAHGVDLMAAAQQTTTTEAGGITAFARMRQLMEPNACVPPPTRSANGRPSHVATRPEWSIAELGQAAQGLGEEPWLAARYTYAGDHTASTYWPLHDALSIEALELRRRCGWSAQVTGVDGKKRFYIQQLASLVLDEDANQWLFNVVPQLYAFYMDVAPEVWSRALAHRFERLRNRYHGWLSVAQQLIQARICEEA